MRQKFGRELEGSTFIFLGRDGLRVLNALSDGVPCVMTNMLGIRVHSLAWQRTDLP